MYTMHNACMSWLWHKRKCYYIYTIICLRPGDLLPTVAGLKVASLLSHDIDQSPKMPWGMTRNIYQCLNALNIYFLPQSLLLSPLISWSFIHSGSSLPYCFATRGLAICTLFRNPLISYPQLKRATKAFPALTCFSVNHHWLYEMTWVLHVVFVICAIIFRVVQIIDAHKSNNIHCLLHQRDQESNRKTAWYLSCILVNFMVHDIYSQQILQDFSAENRK